MRTLTLRRNDIAVWSDTTPFVLPEDFDFEVLGMTTTNGEYIVTAKQDGEKRQAKTYNGSADVALGNIYAPTTAGTDGYILTSNGSGAPTWKWYAWNYFIGTCSSSSTTTTKTVSLLNNDNVFSLREGVIVSVTFTNSNSTSSSATRYLNVDNTGSYIIKDKYGNNFNGTVYTWNSGDTVLFQYRGGQWYTVTGITGNFISGTTTTQNSTYGNSIGDKIVTAWGRESAQFGRFTLSRSNTGGDIVDVSGEEGYWKNQKLTGTAFIPNGEQVRIYQEKMDNITYWIKYLSY